MSGPEHLFENEDRLVTRMGAWFPSERVVYRGKDLHADLSQMGWIELYLYGATGRRFSDAEVKVLNAFWTYTSYPDPRIWSNRIAALTGSARSTGALGVSGAMAACEGTLFGGYAEIRALDFLLRTREGLEKGAGLAEWLKTEIDRNRIIYGYGRPLVKKDERIFHLMKLVEELGLSRKSYLLLALEVERLLNEKSKLCMNFAGLAAALAADMGLSPREFYLFCIPVFVAGMLPCYIEAAEKPEGTLFPLRCDRIRYEGKPRRRWDAASSP